MKTNLVPTPRRNGLSALSGRRVAQFPRDLRVWLRHSSLLTVSQAIAQETDVTAVHPVFSVSAKRFQHPWRMLTLMTYVCAVGVTDDRAAAALAAVEPDLRELCRGDDPSPGVIRRFRNRNRNVITGCIGKLLRHVWCHHTGVDKAALHPLIVMEILSEALSRVQQWASPHPVEAGLED